MEPQTEVLSALAIDTLNGLTATPKQLSSKYFYDKEGSRIFQQIMHMPEYYLTDCEHEIFTKKAHAIVKDATGNNGALELIELGAGDGLKTKLLIKEMFRQQLNFRYVPVDISEEILISMSAMFRKEFEGLEVMPKAGDYFDKMEEIERYNETPKLILFLGSNIGNYSWDESVIFLKHLNQIIHPQDKLLIGFDLKKDPQTILNAYNDAQGYTSCFNINLLRRLNNELGANFELDNFLHAPLYDAQNGVAKSYLVSKADQEVFIQELDTTISFRKWEAIYTEQSQKYDELMIQNIAKESGFEVVRNYYDDKQYFTDSLWKPINR